MHFQQAAGKLAGLHDLRLGGPPGADRGDAGGLEDGVAVVPDQPLDGAVE